MEQLSEGIALPELDPGYKKAKGKLIIEYESFVLQVQKMGYI
jgi:hypothetical protein